MDEPLGMVGLGGVDWLMVGLGCAAKAGIVLASAALLAYGLKRRTAATRHMAWSFGLAGALVLPLLALTLPGWGVPVLSATQDPMAGASPTLEVDQGGTPRLVIPKPAMSEPLTKTIEPPESLPQEQAVVSEAISGPVHERPLTLAWPLVVWGAGTVAVLAWGLLGWVMIWRLGRASEPINEERWVEAVRDAAERLGVAGRVTLRRGGPAAMPLTWGIFRPMLLVPAEADEWPDDRRRAVLLHELAHVRRRDCLTQWLGLAACAAYWFNPLAWWAASRLLVERELACDDLVLEAGERPSEYAAQLLGVARSLRPAPARVPGVMAMAMARPSGLERRLVSILDVRRNRRAPARWLVAVCLLLVLGTSATLAAVQLVTRELPPTVVEGLVVESDGKPLEGAEMVLVLSEREEHGLFDDYYKVKMLGRSRSDAQGRYRIEVKDDFKAPAGCLRLFATAPGFGFAVRVMANLDDQARTPIQLEPEHSVEVRLVNDDGLPLTGIDVRFLYLYPTAGGSKSSPSTLSSLMLPRESLPTLTGGWITDADGRFTLRGLNAGYSVGIYGIKMGVVAQQALVSTTANVRHLTVTFGLARRIEGRVTLGKGGPPAVGARVLARSWPHAGALGRMLNTVITTTSADGHYQLETAPGASVLLGFDRPPEGADASLMTGSLVVEGDDVGPNFDFALPRGVVVRGRVTESGTDKPIGGVIVTHRPHKRNNPYYVKRAVSWFTGGRAPHAVTAADGTFQLVVVPGPGYLLVDKMTDDYLREELPSDEMDGWESSWQNTRRHPYAFRKLDTRPGNEPVNGDLVLRRGVTASGHLVDPQGRPVQHAILFSRWYLDKRSLGFNDGAPGNLERTQEGRFELTTCDPRSSAPVFFLEATQQLGAVVELSGKQANNDLEVKMQPCGSATARILDAQGKPLKSGFSPMHFEVVLTPGAFFGDRGNEFGKGAGKRLLIAESIAAVRLDPERYRDLKPDADGRITFPTLIPGATYRMCLVHQEGEARIEFTVKPGEARDLGDLVIQKFDPTL